MPAYAPLLARQLSWLAAELAAEQRLPAAAAYCAELDRCLDLLPVACKVRAWLWTMRILENAAAGINTRR